MVDALLACLQSVGYRVSLDAKGRYTQGLVHLMGELSELDFLRDAYMIRLLSNAQLRKGKAFTQSQLQQIANPQSHTERFYEQLDDLVEKWLFLQGYNLTCPTCYLDLWYSLDNLSARVLCQGCRSPLSIPSNLAIAYRPNPLLVEALKSGAMTILLVALWLAQHNPTMQWDTGLLVQKGNVKTDIDFIAMINDDLWLIECKDNFRSNDKVLDDLIKQLQVGQTIAQEVDAKHYVFATLYPEVLPERLSEFLLIHDISILTRADLLRRV